MLSVRRLKVYIDRHDAFAPRPQANWLPPAHDTHVLTLQSRLVPDGNVRDVHLSGLALKPLQAPKGHKRKMHTTASWLASRQHWQTVVACSGHCVPER
jgi:hypothetical protein